jgi:ABC-type multidrug transport system fused ATPase/permease subunit
MSSKQTKEESHKGRQRTAFLLALAGGICMLVAGVSGGVAIYAFAFNQISAELPQLATVLGYLLAALTIIASLGGIAVIVGGIMILGGRITSGKLFIGLGAGFGIFSVIVGLATGLAQGWGLVASAEAIFATGQTLGWVGIFLSIFARFAAKK